MDISNGKFLSGEVIIGQLLFGELYRGMNNVCICMYVCCIHNVILSKKMQKIGRKINEIELTIGEKCG